MVPNMSVVTQNMKSTLPPILRHVGSLWSLTEYPSARADWSLERKMRAIKEAGFDAVWTLPTPDHHRLAQKLGLTICGYFASGKASEFASLL